MSAFVHKAADGRDAALRSLSGEADID